MSLRLQKSLLRPRGGQARVTNVELFVDLVFASAVTRLSHALVLVAASEPVSPRGRR